MEDKELIDINELLKKAFAALLRSWKTGLLLILLGMGIMGYRTYRNYRPMFRSQVTFVVSREINGEKSFFYNKKATENLAVSVQSLLNSDLMTEAICEELQMDYIPAALGFWQVGTTNLFTVYADGTTKEQSKQVVDAFVNNYPRVFRISLTDIDLEIIEEPELPQHPFNQPIYWKQCAKGAIAAFPGLWGVHCALYFFPKDNYGGRRNKNLSSQ